MGAHKILPKKYVSAANVSATIERLRKVYDNKLTRLAFPSKIAASEAAANVLELSASAHLEKQWGRDLPLGLLIPIGVFLPGVLENLIGRGISGAGRIKQKFIKPPKAELPEVKSNKTSKKIQDETASASNNLIRTEITQLSTPLEKPTANKRPTNEIGDFCKSCW